MKFIGKRMESIFFVRRNSKKIFEQSLKILVGKFQMSPIGRIVNMHRNNKKNKSGTS